MEGEVVQEMSGHGRRMWLETGMLEMKVLELYEGFGV